MALTKISRGLLSTGVSDSSDATAITIDSSERVGIGTTSPAQNLHIHCDSGDEGILLKGTGNTSHALTMDANRSSAGGGLGELRGLWNGTEVARIVFRGGDDTTNKDDGLITFSTSTADNISERMRINSDGKVGIGTTAPHTTMVVNGGTFADIALQSSNSGTGSGQGSLVSIDTSNNLYLWNFENTPTIFGTNNVERMRIDSGGGVAIGTTSPDGVSNLTVKSQNSTAGQEFVSLHHQASSGTIYFMSFMTGSGSDVGYITFTGTTGAFTAASDISLKENIRDLPEGLDVITQLKPRLSLIHI